MKRQTREELAAECVRLRTENTVLSHAVDFLLARKRPNAVETVREKGGGNYAYQAFDVCAPHGGILLVTYFYPGQRPMTTTHYLARYGHDRHWLPEQLDHRCAVERLQRKAHALQRATMHEGAREL